MSDNESSGSSSSQGSSTDGDALFVRCVHASAEVITSLIQQEAVSRRRTYINRDRAAANELLVRDYFCDEPTYDETKFARRFRMSRRLFLRIAEDLKNTYHYFQQHYDARGKLGFTNLQKCTSAVRQLAYGTASDSWDEYLKMADKTSRDTLYEFCDGIIELYGAKYLRKPTWSDIQSLYEVHEEVHGLPGMLGSIDCMHWEWANCPTAICTEYIPDTPANQEWSDEQRIAIRRQLRDKDTHANLRQDLTEHVWVNRNNED